MDLLSENPLSQTRSGRELEKEHARGLF